MMLKKLLASLFITLLIMLGYGVDIIDADVIRTDDSTSIMNDYEAPKSMYKQGIEPPYSANEAFEDRISPETGDLEIKQTDIYLKGRNGLDFALARYYSLSNANLYVGFVNATQVSSYYIEGKKILLHLDSSGYIIRSEVIDSHHMISGFSTYKEAQVWANDLNNGVYDCPPETPILDGDPGHLLQFRNYSVKTATLGYIYSDDVEGSTVNDEQFDLGAGWAFDLPYLEVRSWASPVQVILHNGSAGTWTYDPDYDWGGSHLEGYFLKDMVFGPDSGTFTCDGKVSSYRLTEKDGRKIYFDSIGRLLGIQDRFGNTIQFKGYTGSLIGQIVDSVGRVINISYVDATHVNINITDPTDSTQNKTITYIKYKLPDRYKARPQFQPDEYLLYEVIDAQGRHTSFDYGINEARFSMTNKNLAYHTNQNNPFEGVSNYYACLTQITHPTRAKTMFGYELHIKNLGQEGSMQFYKTKQRFDLMPDNNIKSSIRYQYNGISSNEYDGYPQYITLDNQVTVHDIPMDYETSAVEYFGGTSTGGDIKSNIYYFNFKLLEKQIIQRAGDNRTYIDNTYDLGTSLGAKCTKLLLSSQQTYYPDRNQFIPSISKTEVCEYDQNDMRNVVKSWSVLAEGNKTRTDYMTVYTYHPLYNYITGKTYKKDAGTTITEQYIPTDDAYGNVAVKSGKAVRYQKVSENNVLKKKVEYGYDNYGNISQIKEYLYDSLHPTDWNDETKTVSEYYSYDDNDTVRINANKKLDGVYLTKTMINGVKDADRNLVAPKNGNPAGVIDTVSGYDWFGNLKNMVDGNGGTIRFNYDKLGRKTYEENQDGSHKLYNWNDTSNILTVTDERGSVFQYAYDELGNLVYEKDGATGKAINTYEYDILSQLSREYNNDKKTSEYEYVQEGKIKSKETKEQSGWFEKSFPKGAQIIQSSSDEWKWVYSSVLDQYQETRNITDVHEHGFEGALDKMEIGQGDYVFVEIQTNSQSARPSEVMLQFKENGSWEHRAYWGANTINLGADGTESRKYIGSIPVYGEWCYLLIPADQIGLAGKSVDGIKFTLSNGVARFRRVGVLRGTSSFKSLYKEEYTYDYGLIDPTHEIYTKTIVGNANSPSVTTKSYIDKYGRGDKTGRLYDGIEHYDTFQYDYLGNKTGEKSARAYNEGWSQLWTTKYEYDYAGKPVKVTNIRGEYTTTEYDALGRVVKVTDAKGNLANPIYSTEYVYDNMGRVIEEKLPFENVSGAVNYTIKRHYYDRNGNVTLEKISKNKPVEALSFNQTEYGYNIRNMLILAKTFNAGVPENYTQYHYDTMGNKLRMYTGLKAPLTINGLDNITPSTDTDYSVTKYEYDRFSNLTKMTDPLGQIENYAYDLNGNMVSKVDRNGSMISMTYDGLDRLLANSVTNAAMPGYNASITYMYTLTGNRLSINGGSSSNYEYDALGRLKKEIEGQITKEYTYDAASNRKTLVIKQSGQVVSNTSYTYDNLNRLYQVSENGQLAATYTYDPNGNRQSLTYSNGDSTDYTYNLANKLKTLTNKKGSVTLSGYAYEYSLDGNQTRKSDNAGKITDYTYDGLGRLRNEAATGENAVSYAYDDSNNRKTMTIIGGAVTTYVYDKNNRLDSETEATGDATEITTYRYDGNGNQTYKGKETIKPAVAGESEGITASVLGEGSDDMGVTVSRYDGFNRLVTAATGSMSATYTYNGDGLRISKTVNGVMTRHVWDGSQIALELNGAGTVTQKYIRGINLIAAENGSGVRSYYLYNGHGDVVKLANSSGDAIKSYDYDAFGNEKNIDNNDTNVFRYAGEYFDKETGTIYLRARYYNPEIGRFITEDSYWGEDSDPLMLNLYTYCYNDPVNRIDPSGHVAPLIAAALIYLGETALETIPDVLIDMLLEGDSFVWWKSALGNYGTNVIPGLGEAKKAVKAAKLAKKYGPEVVEYLTKHGSDITSNISQIIKIADRYGTDGIARYMKVMAKTATKGNYADLFMEVYQNLPIGFQIHHTLPQKYESIMAKAGINIHELKYLKGVDAKIHSALTDEWQKWEKALERTPTAQDITNFSNKIISKYADKWFNP